MKRVGPNSLNSWFAAIYSSLIGMLLCGVVRLSGLLFVTSMDQFQVDRQEALLSYILCDTLQEVEGLAQNTKWQYRTSNHDGPTFHYFLSFISDRLHPPDMALERKRSSRRGGPGSRHRKRPPENKCKSCCRRFTAFMFSHVGLCALVVGYSILGAFAFQALEAPYEEQKVDEVMHKRMDTVKRLWAITDQLNVLYKENWTRQVTEEVKRFQADLVHAIKEGYDGKEGTGTQWTFSGAFLYSLTVITTIGKCYYVCLFNLFICRVKTHVFYKPNGKDTFLPFKKKI
ncbi:uncharacterized protein TNIN_302811 [Trichonephila inaurata madagascariensis]|uniref:TWiK family of potassium channels protein 7 n=1 Tax=Trichonephila inaurata madagascariensis TaxID=2747483 RepID=A0A8X6WQZ5_9ARAC|nr:uncharacterized protein TNIN_302811 [Trichonephila inaurata madagascariensis]